MAYAPIRGLSPEQKAFVVRKIAAFEPVRAITSALAALYPTDKFNENDILTVDPRVTLVSPELYALFLAERERVMCDPGSAIYAEQKARLIVLSRQVDAYLANNQPVQAATVLRQIAEEQGVVGGKVGKTQGEATVPVTEIRRTIVAASVAELPSVDKLPPVV